MQNLDAIREALPDAAKDLKLNIQAVLRPERLTQTQTLGTALACAYFVRCKPLADALITDAAEAGATPEVIDDAKAAASIMGMNTTYYRFRHMMGENSVYNSKPAQLRMTRMARPTSDKATFELMSMACAALAGCEMCLKAHEQSLLKEGLSEDQVHDSVRIAAVVQGLVVAMGM